MPRAVHVHARRVEDERETHAIALVLMSFLLQLVRFLLTPVDQSRRDPFLLFFFWTRYPEDSRKRPFLALLLHFLDPLPFFALRSRLVTADFQKENGDGSAPRLSLNAFLLPQWASPDVFSPAGPTSTLMSEPNVSRRADFSHRLLLYHLRGGIIF